MVLEHDGRGHWAPARVTSGLLRGFEAVLGKEILAVSVTHHHNDIVLPYMRLDVLEKLRTDTLVPMFVFDADSRENWGFNCVSTVSITRPPRGNTN